MPEKKRLEDDWLTRAVEFFVGSESPKSPAARRRLDRWNQQPAEQRDVEEGQKLMREWQHGKPKNDPGDATRSGASMAAARRKHQKQKTPQFIGLDLPSDKPKPRPALQVAKAGAAEEGSMRARLSAAQRGPIAPEALQRVAKLSPLVAQHLGGDELEDARQQERERRFAARLARAGAMFTEGVTGARYERDAYDDLEKDASIPVEDALLRRRMGQEDRDFSYRQERDASEDSLREREMDLRAADREADNRYRMDVLSEQRRGNVLREIAMRQERADAAEQKRRDMLDRQNEKDMAEMGKRTDKLAQTKADVETVNRFMGDGGDIPGAGVWDSLKMESALLRAVFASEDDVKSWQASQRMAANYLNTMTGQSFTEAEAARTLSRYGVRPGTTEQEWKSGMSDFIRDVKAGLVQKEAPFAHVREEFRRRGGVTAQDIPDPAVESKPTGTTITMPDGSVWMEMSNGKARQISGPTRSTP